MAWHGMARRELVDAVVGENEISYHLPMATSQKNLQTTSRIYVRGVQTIFQQLNKKIENADLISKGSDDLGRTDMVHQQINKGESAPMR